MSDHKGTDITIGKVFTNAFRKTPIPASLTVAGAGASVWSQVQLATALKESTAAALQGVNNGGDILGAFTGSVASPAVGAAFLLYAGALAATYKAAEYTRTSLHAELVKDGLRRKYGMEL